jgi:hypothetical protein
MEKCICCFSLVVLDENLYVFDKVWVTDSSISCSSWKNRTNNESHLSSFLPSIFYLRGRHLQKSQLSSERENFSQT